MARLSLSDVSALVGLNPRFIKFLQAEQATGTPAMTLSDVVVKPNALEARLKLSLSAEPRDSIVTSYLTRNGIGTNQGTNYVAASGAIVWQPGEPTEREIVVTLKGNNVVGNTIQVLISSTISGASLAKQIGTISFSTDDQVAGPSGFNLVFQHNFIDGFDATPTGSNCWKSQLAHGRTQSGNKELGYYADQTSVPASNPFPVIDGKRRIRSESFPNGVLDANSNPIPCPWTVVNGVVQPFRYTAAVLTSQNWPAAQVGPDMRVEARLAMPMLSSAGVAKRGAWPAFWLMPMSGAWPPEIDMMEWPIKADWNAWTYYTTQHWPAGTRGYPVDIRLLGATENLTGFHTYGVTLTDETISFDLDGKRTIVMDNRSPGQSWYVLLNVAMGGSWPGSPLSTTEFPCDMILDWIKFYAKA